MSRVLAPSVMPPSATHPVRIRLATAEDYPVLADIMFDAVRHGPSEYTEPQRVAWLRRPCEGPTWFERLDRQRVFLAQLHDETLGFMSLDDEGYIDLAFVRPSSQRTGVLRRLYQSAEATALRNRIKQLSVHASLMARPAFASLGFVVVGNETVEIDGQALARFEMRKIISRS